ncbi:ABC transporter permease [Marinibaculum pumilum]|uniref:ABC transporter permease n=1 Tax=Marinibaculum pumilum TaxID=1766165 RepID=A0ABV7KYK5_9PROT
MTAQSVPAARPVPEEPATLTPNQLMRYRAKRHPGLLLGGGVTLAIVLAALLAPWIAPYDPIQQDLLAKLKPPVWAEGGSWAHVFGTDIYGRDFFSRILYGARVSVFIGFFAAFVSAIVGAAIGVVGGYFGGRVDAVVMYLVNVKLALPGLMVALALVSVTGGSILALVLILAFLFWDRYAIVCRTVTQQLRGQEFVQAAVATGASTPRILWSEILPNLFSHIVVMMSMEMALAIVVEAALSFLGLGVQPPTPSWGLLIAEGRQFLFFKPSLIVIPGIAIFVLVIAINLLGDGIRDVTATEGKG